MTDPSAKRYRPRFGVEPLEALDFTGFHWTAVEVAASRMYGGIHFGFDNETGLMVDGEVADAS
jgi:hypothetical protein